MDSTTKPKNTKRNVGWALLSIGILCILAKQRDYFDPDAALAEKLKSLSMNTILEVGLTTQENQSALRDSIKSDAAVGLVICTILTIVGASLLVLHYRRKRNS
jgi:hypothetical protein